jgi:hypothetical protein
VLARLAPEKDAEQLGDAPANGETPRRLDLRQCFSPGNGATL